MNSYQTYVILLLPFLFSACLSTSQQEESAVSETILINQIGYYPDEKKTAVYKGDREIEGFQLLDAAIGEVVYKGNQKRKSTSPYSSANTYVLDFTDFEEPGEYYIQIPEIGKSYPFSIKPTIHEDVLRGALKSYYFQRTYIPLTPEFSGKWARNAGHPDTLVYVHSSAASPQRPEGTIISAPYGWYDAGDYNKYIVNSGISVGTLLSLYEDFSPYFNEFTTKIPESSNNIPDLLDEALFNIRWMLAMQDPHDGGVYHKLTTADFEGMIIPSEANSKRYVVKKSTAATLDFAAVMAQSARIFLDFDDELPGFADSCLVAATYAWKWAKENPAVAYDQNNMNKEFSPAINTGSYDDENFDDEWAWAAAELWITTGDDTFGNTQIIDEEGFTVPNWSNVHGMAYYSLIRHQQSIINTDLVLTLVEQLLEEARKLADHTEVSAYGVAMGKDRSDFVWGSNAVAANQSMALIYAYGLTSEEKFLEAATSNLDYILGKNATGYSFVTGFGFKTPMHPHHRPSVADEIIEPIPGLVAGGPNPGQQDNCDYPTSNADESYVDHDCSYASNEIAINWNAPFVYIAGAIEALKDGKN